MLLLYSVRVIVRDIELCFMMPFTPPKKERNRKKNKSGIPLSCAFHYFVLASSFHCFSALLAHLLSHFDLFQSMSVTQAFTHLLFVPNISWAHLMNRTFHMTGSGFAECCHYCMPHRGEALVSIVALNLTDHGVMIIIECWSPEADPWT